MLYVKKRKLASATDSKNYKFKSRLILRIILRLNPNNLWLKQTESNVTYLQRFFNFQRFFSQGRNELSKY
jgi:hypothetical protein